jgi:hypothetical protein
MGSEPRLVELADCDAGEALRRPSEECLPNFLCIGAPKCGTTSLAGMLAAHPAIFMPPQKELNALHYNDLDARLPEYAAYFANAGDAKIRCDFSVRYLASPTAPDAARRLIPDAKILAILRSPVDQVQSHYWHLLRQNFHQGAPVVPQPDLFSALERFPALLFEPALYGKHLLRWRERYPSSNILVLHYADLKTALGPTIDRICDFLGIPRKDLSAVTDAISATASRRGVQPRKNLVSAIFPPLYVAVAQGPYRWVKTKFGVQRAESLKRALKLRQISEAIFFKPGYPKLERADQIRLYQHFAADVELLTSHTEIDVSSWDPSR